ncbi:MAG: N-acetyltransferase family protein [Bacteriovorax sp.]
MDLDKFHLEDLVLKDHFEIRAICPSDKEGLQEGLALLSNQSRRQRFFSARKDLTDKELKFYTEVDQHDHIAFVAVHKSESEGAHLAGTIRCVRDPGRPDYAELAVTIADRFQGQGLGSALLEILAKAAQSENIAYLYGDLEASNTRMLKLLERYCSKHQRAGQSLRLTHKSDGFLYFEMALA